MTKRRLLDKTNEILRSTRLFWVIMIVFVFESVWIALSAVYPQAFDENFHFGLIQLYSHHWLPFLSHQPPNANAYGAVARDPSYLYHYLMSFPYRLIELFVHNQPGQIISLRLINIVIFGIGLILFRKVLQRAHVSSALINITMSVFVLIPVVSQLAAHINYDNLLFPLVAWVCLLSFTVIDQLRARKPNARTLVTLVIVCLFTSLVKYAFLPIFLGVALYLAYLEAHVFWGKFDVFWKQLWRSWTQQRRYAQVLLGLLLVISIGMFAQRDLVNVVEYHTIVPSCSQVLTVNQCKAYSVWDYDYVTHQQVLATKPGVPLYNPVSYFGVWIYWMWYRLFFAINGPASGFTNYPPLPLPSAAAALLFIAGAFVVFKYRHKIFQNNPYMTLFCVITFFYIAALWIDGYTEYRYTHILQAMNGRYLLPVLILAGAIIGRAFSLSMKNMPARKTIFAVVVLLLFMQGGGVLTFISRSDPTWYWDNQSVVKVNLTAQKLTKRVIVKGRKTYSTSVWFYN
jgi:hypothetical protein